MTMFNGTEIKCRTSDKMFSETKNKPKHVDDFSSLIDHVFMISVNCSNCLLIFGISSYLLQVSSRRGLDAYNFSEG